MASLFEKIGGDKTLRSVVDKFFELMMADEKLSEFFKTTDIAKEKEKQVQYLTKITGGPHHYEGKDMKDAHSKVHVGGDLFDRSWSMMEKAFAENGVKGDSVAEVKELFFAVKKDVVHE